MKTLFLILTLLALPVSAAGLCKCVDCKNPNCECTCPPGNCTCPDCAGKTPPPSLLLPPDVHNVDVDDLYAFDGSEGRDSQWYADVEKSLQYLYRSHQAMDKRVTRLEQAMIRVNTPRGVETRTVTVQNECGTFQLNPGETLAGYQDTSGRWVSAASQPTRVVRYIQGNPVMSYPSVGMEVRTVASTTPTRGLLGAIRMRATNCRTVNGVTYCN